MKYRTSEIAQKIAAEIPAEIAAEIEAKMPAEIEAEIPGGSVSAGASDESYPDTRPGACYPASILYSDGFYFPDKRARLQVITEQAMFEEAVRTSSLFKAVDADLPKPEKK
jgi:hypothetical protein